MMIDSWIHDTADPIHADFGDYVCPIEAVSASGECGTAESGVSV